MIMSLGSEWQALGVRVAQQTQQFHNDVMDANAEHLRVEYDAMPRRSRRAKVAIASGTILLIGLIAFLVAL
jgi:hypothetical protein